MEIYIIEKLWYDPTENRSAYSYRAYTWRGNKESAESFVTEGGNTPKDKCWAFTSDMPNYRVSRLDFLGID